MRQIKLLWIIVAMLFLAGCTSLPKDYPKAPSTAFKAHKSTSIGKMFDREAAKHPGKSGFNIIRYGRSAFTLRIAMIEMAEKSLDLQYYV